MKYPPFNSLLFVGVVYPLFLENVSTAFLSGLIKSVTDDENSS